MVPFNHCSLFLVLVLLTTVLAPSTVAQEEKSETVQAAAAAEGYALYSLPPFTVSMTSNYTLGGLPVDSLERATLLASSLHQPLKIITSEFLLESFRLDLARQPRSYQNQTASMRAFLDTFMTLDLQVAVKAVEHLDIEDGITDDNNNNNARLLRQLQQEKDTEQEDPLQGLPRTSSSRNQQQVSNNVLQFQADFFTTAAFVVEPSTSANQPTNQEVSAVLGVWMDNAFSQDKPYYYDLLRNSGNSVLEHLLQLYIETNSKAVFDPSTTGTMTTTDTDSTAAGGNTNNNVNNANNTESHVTAHGWTPKEKLFFTILVCVAAVSLAGLLFAVSHHVKKGERRAAATNNENLSSHHNNTRDYYDDEEECIGGRHADEIMEVLHASDRYLANYRPDLLAKYNGSHESGGGGGEEPMIPVANTTGTGPAAASAANTTTVERRYVTPSNPFQYLYGASYFHRERQAVEQEQAQRRRQRQDPMDSVELVPDDEPTEQVVSGYLQSWFQRVVMRRRCSSEQQQQDDEDVDDNFYSSNHEYTTNHHHDQVADEYGDMACNEDPSSYAFAFSDFPRNDGTPCLIYEETLNEEEEEQYLSQQQLHQRLNYSTSSFGENNQLLTDEEFQRALMMKNSNNNIIDHDTSHIFMDNNSSISSNNTGGGEDDENVLQDLLKEDKEKASPAEEEDHQEDDPAMFTNKLERLVAMRHRHYEKQRIVEKHREQRRQERAKQRASQQQEEMQKRDRLLRRHSLELDIQELEATWAAASSGTAPIDKKTPLSVSKKTTPTSTSDSSTGKNPEQQMPRSIQKPNLHRRTSSEADVSGVGGVHTPPSSGIKSNRSMDMDDAAGAAAATNNKKSTIGSTNGDFMKENNGRMVQSARKQSRSNLGMNSNNTNVFRTIDITPTGGNNNNNNNRISAVVSPATSSMTETGSTTMSPSISSTGDVSNSPSSSSSSSNNLSAPPLVTSNNSLSGSIRDGTSARKKKRPMSSASMALAQGFKARRSMSFGNVEEKKTDDDRMMTTIDGGAPSTNRTRPMVPRQHQSQQQQQQQQQQPPRRRSQSVTRSNSIGGHRRSNSSSTTEDLSVHGIYAQFV